VSNDITIENAIGAINARGIVASSGKVTILSPIAHISDSIYAGGALLISASVSVDSTNATSAIQGRSVTINGGTINATLKGNTGAGISVPAGGGDLLIESPAVLNNVDSIVNYGTGRIDISGGLSSGGIRAGVVNSAGTTTLSTNGNIGIITGGVVEISEGSRITADSIAIAAGKAITIDGSLTSNRRINIEGNFDLTPKGALTVPTNNDADSTLIAGSVTLLGKVSGSIDSVSAKTGKLTISTNLTAKQLSALSGEVLIDNGATVSIGSVDSVTPLITSPKVTITDRAIVKSAGTDSVIEVLSSDFVIKNHGSLARTNGDTVIFARGQELRNDSYQLDGSATIKRPGYPTISSVDISYKAEKLTIVITGDSLLNTTNDGDPIVWLNYFDEYGYQYSTNADVEGKQIGKNDVLTLVVGSDKLSSEAYVSVSTVRGVAIAKASNPSPSGEVTRDDKPVSQPAGESFIESTNWDSLWDLGLASTYVYSDDTLRVTFTFAKQATKNETIEYGGLYTTYLDANRSTLPAGSKSVEVTFTFKKSVNPTLRAAVLRTIDPGYITAKIPGDDVDLYGTASAGPFQFYDAFEIAPTIVVGTIGYEGEVSFAKVGGSPSTKLYLPWKSTWVNLDYSFTSADKSSLFESGGYVLIKDPNTGDAALRINGPNTTGGSGGGDIPDANHRVHLEYNPHLQTSYGLYPSLNQSFTFNVARPLDVEEDDLVVTVVSLDDAGTPYASEAIVTLVENIDKDGWKVLVTNITTETRITISFRVSTGTELLSSSSVWGSSGLITITSPVSGIARIYSLRGALVSEFPYKEGITSVSLPVGIYIVTLGDGNPYKVLVK
jgi:hypothetical protein